MKVLILVLYAISACVAESSIDQMMKAKHSVKGNSVSSSPKPEIYFNPLRLHPQYVPVQYAHKAAYIPQQQPAMIIIAQPALIPQHMLYGNAIQQLLNYFHSNPQARHQFLHGNYKPQPTVATYAAQAVPVPVSVPVAAAGQQATYQILAPAAAATQYAPVAIAPEVAAAQYYGYSKNQEQPQQEQQPYVPPQQQTYQLSDIAKLAQATAQQITGGRFNSPPTIVTGLEKFSPEQQAKIKAQLSSHFGSDIATLSDEATQGLAKYHSNSEEFVPSPQVKNEDSGYESSGQVFRIHRITKS